MEQIVVGIYGTLIDEAGEWLIGSIVVYWVCKTIHLLLQKSLHS